MDPINQRPVPDDQVLTEFGTLGKGFVNAPTEGWADLSLIFGRLTASEACTWVRRRSNRTCQHNPPDGDLARYTTAGTLRSAGFLVEQTGKRLDHVGVGHPGEWGPAERVTLDGCFEKEAS